MEHEEAQLISNAIREMRKAIETLADEFDDLRFDTTNELAKTRAQLGSMHATVLALKGMLTKD